MQHLIKTVAAALIAVAPAGASAADWWWVAGEPGGDEASFIDVETMRSNGTAVSFTAQHVTRGGSPRLTQHEVRCDAPAAVESPDAALRRFACATPAERNRTAIMLGAMFTPEQAAEISFAMPRR